jgi:type IV secretion system protein TrbL
MTPRLSRTQRHALAAAFLLCLASPALLAQTGQLDTMVNATQTASQGWLNNVIPEALNLYYPLVGLEIVMTLMVWSYMYLSGKLSPGSMLASLFQKLMLLGFFLVALQSFPLFLPKILATFQVAGARVSAIQGIGPSALLNQGVFLAAQVLYITNRVGLLELPAALTGLLVALTLLVCFVLLAWRLTSLLIESHILLGAGALFLGFGASRITVQLAENYVISLFRLGIHTYLIYMMIAVGNFLVPTWAQQINGYLYDRDGFAALFRIAGEVLIFTLITIKLPSRLAYELTAPSGFLHLRQTLTHTY